MLMRLFATGLVLCVCCYAQMWPGITYDPAIPTFQKILGYGPGEQITTPADIVRYAEALAAAAPGRVRVFDYGRTWEGRRLLYFAVGSEANIRRVAEVKAGMGRLADPRKTPEAEARTLIASLPAVVWLSYGVHGNEISSPDAALFTAYHLLAARKDPVVNEVLANAIVLIDPLQNPDGRERFLQTFRQAEGLEPDIYPLAAEHNEPWPGGRANHYLFDLNRDWIGATQPEIRGQMRSLLEWFPLVYADLHEMGRDATYFFSPEAVPFNPNLAREQVEDLSLFGRNNARWFDQFGFSYFIREVFDAFYPGYGASWPSYYGGVAMTYEQASARGLRVQRSDDTVLTFGESMRHHFVASVSTCETAARNREKLLEHFYRYRQTAIREGGREPVRAYVLPRTGDTSTVDKLAGLLAMQGVEVYRSTAGFESGGRKFPAGSYVVPLAQPAKRLVRTLLDPAVPMDPAFLKEQERRRKKRLPGEIYDVTAWSLPLLFNVECVGVASDVEGAFTPVVAGAARPGGVTGEHARLAYLAPWGTSAAGRLLTAALRQGLNVWSSDKAFRQGERRYPAGTLIFRVHENPDSLETRLRELARWSGAEVVAVDSGWVDEGPSFGSGHVVHVRRPAVALAWDSPTNSGSAGAIRFLLEREFGYPVTAGGGTLIGLGSTVSFLADPKVGMLAVSQENLAAPGPDFWERQENGVVGEAPGSPNWAGVRVCGEDRRGPAGAGFLGEVARSLRAGGPSSSFWFSNTCGWWLPFPAGRGPVR